ncbi:4c85457a-eb0e-4f3c-a584-3b56caf247a5 [Thermothielavioides terrestris]
MRYKA